MDMHPWSAFVEIFMFEFFTFGELYDKIMKNPWQNTYKSPEPVERL